MTKRIFEPEQIEAVVTAAVEMYRKECGPLDLSEGSRDFLEEAEDELLYVVNASIFQILKIRHIRESWLRRVKLWAEEKKLNGEWKEEAEDDPEKAEETRLKYGTVTEELDALSRDPLIKEIDRLTKSAADEIEKEDPV